MNHLKVSCKALFVVSLVLLFSAPASAQLVRPRKPSEPVIKPDEKPYKTAPKPAEREAMAESIIRNVSISRSGQNVSISFTAFPNTVPLVEWGKVQPKFGADGRWAFPPGSGSVTRPAGGDKAKGEYSVDMNQELETGAMYYYIISATSEDGVRRHQTTGDFPYVARFLVRYRGFVCQDKTDGPGSDEIYAIVSASFPDPRGRPGTVTQTHPHVTVEGVDSGAVHGDAGRNVYEGGTTSLLLSVTLMEYDGGNPSGYRNAVDAAVVGAYSQVLRDNPQLKIGEALNGDELTSATFSISDATRKAVDVDDDVIGISTRLFTVGELVKMANGPPSYERGIQYNFFTEHRGHGGIYRVYFDVIPK